MKIKKLKLLSLLIAMVLTFSVMCGCNENNGKNSGIDKNILDKNSPVTITVWHYYNGIQQTKFENYVKKFNETVGSENGIIVEAITKNSIDELAEKIKASVDHEPGADQLPNVITCYADTAYNLDVKNALIDLRKYFSDEELSEYEESYIKEGEFDGKTLKIFPTAKSTEVMILNKTDWDKFASAEKVSEKDLETWESMIKVAKKYYEYTDNLTPDVKNDGKAFFGRDSIANYMTLGLEQLGVNLVKVDENGNAEYVPDKQAVKTLWENYYVPYVKGYFTSESRYRSDDMKIGKIIAAVGSTSGALYFSDEVTVDDSYTYNVENKVLPVPHLEGKNDCPIQQGGGMSVLKSNEKEEYACSVFIKWFTDVEINTEFAAESGYLPVKKEANDFNKIKKVMDNSSIKYNQTTADSMKLAIDGMKKTGLYFSNPFKNSGDFRNALGDLVENSAKETHKKVEQRLKNGEDREKVLEEYTDNRAFEIWYGKFELSIKKIL